MSTAKPDDEPERGQVLSLPQGPTVLRIALGGQLRRLRERAGISREAAGDAIRGSHAKISRLELGRVGFKQRDLVDLLVLYGITDPAEQDSFLALARRANTPGWWHQYSDLLPAWFQTYIGLEQAASMIRGYEAQFVPGLLQTADYARAVILLGHSTEPTEEVERRVELRMQRQTILARPDDPPNLWVVIDEGALRRPYGDADTHRGQLQHLVECGDRPNVTIQVAPYAIGGHAAAGGGFSVLRFGESELPDIVYLEQLTSSLYLDKRADLDRYLAVMDRLSVQSLTPDDSRRFLLDLIDS